MLMDYRDAVLFILREGKGLEAIRMLSTAIGEDVGKKEMESAIERERIREICDSDAEDKIEKIREIVNRF